MKTLLLSLIFAFVFLGCEKQEPSTMSLKRYHSFDKFDYSKKDIEFFEKSFEEIKEFENIELLEKYVHFYKQNQTYFINGKQKVQTLEKKIQKLKKQKVQNQLSKLQEAQDLQKHEKISEAIRIYKDLAKQNNIKALRELVDIYKISSPSLAKEYLEKLVELEDIGSMKEYASANIYMVKPIEMQNIKKAVQTYEKLVELGDASSMMILGNIYEYGYHKDDVPKDLEKSLEYYEMASKLGYIPAKEKLYKIYTCKKCKPNRINEERAKVLQKKLIKELNKKFAKIGTKKKKKPAISSHMRKQLKEIKTPIIKKDAKDNKKDLIAVFPLNNNYKKLATIKCYDMKTALGYLSKQCKKKIRTNIKKIKKISKINIIAVLDKNDKSFYIKKVKERILYEALFEALAKKRVKSAVEYLKGVLKDDQVINISLYYVTSKKENKGVVIRVY